MAKLLTKEELTKEAFEIKWKTYGLLRFLALPFKPLCEDWFYVGVECGEVIKDFTK